jgi:hypothetical protein
MRRQYWVLFTIGFSLLLITACNMPSLKSTRRETVSSRGMAITNSNLDSIWINALTYSLEDKNITIGFQNDADNLYIMLRATDRETQAKIMRTGLTIWLDASGKKKKTFGIHYPLGMQGRRTPPEENRQLGDNPGEFRRRFSEMPDSMEIIGPQKNEVNKIHVINNELGITVTSSAISGALAFELKVPLKASNESLFAINIANGNTIDLGLETGDFKAESRERPRENGERPGRGEGGGRPGGGFGGRGGMGGRGGDMPHGDRPGGMNTDPIKFWAKVTLVNGFSGGK